MKIAMLELKIDVCQPGFDGAGVLEDILLVDSIFFGLDSGQRVFSGSLGRLGGWSNSQ